MEAMSNLLKNGKDNFILRRDYQSAFILKGFDYKYWTAIPNQLLADRRISSGARDLWILLQALGDAKGLSYYGQKKLARFFKVGIRTVQRYQNELTKYGWLIVEPGTEYRSNRYFVGWPPGINNPKWNSYLKKEKNSKRR